MHAIRIGLRRAHQESQPDEKDDPDNMGARLTFASVTWWTMIASAAPIESLSTPQELQGDQIPDDIITFEIRNPTEEPASIERLAKATSLILEAYKSVAKIYAENIETLTIVKVESGSGIRIDCKGLGEPIKHLKDLILEAWHKLRHKRHEEVIENNKALFSSLAIMDKIASMERDNKLGKEDAEILRKKIITSVSGLFECGALIPEIPEQETVQNTKLLSEFVSKMLLPPPNKVEEKTVSRKRVRKK